MTACPRRPQRRPTISSYGKWFELSRWSGRLRHGADQPCGRDLSEAPGSHRRSDLGGRAAGLLIVMLGVSLLVAGPSESHLLSLATALVGVGAWYASPRVCRSDAMLRRAALVLIGVGTAVALVGVAGMEWEGPGLPKKSFDTAQLGGVLTLVIPVAAALATMAGPTRWVALACLLGLSPALVLTQSRAALVGVGLALLIVLWRRASTRGRVVFAGLALLSGLGGRAVERIGWLAESQQVVAALDSITGRLEIWRRSIAMLLDMPLTGIGLDNYPFILRSFYPTIYVPESFVVPHAHNFVLQTALDVGLPGLAAYAVLVVTAVRGGLAGVRGDGQRQVTAGLLLGMLAYGIFGLVDAVPIDSANGLLLWFVLGLLRACGAIASKSSSSAPVEQDESHPKRRRPRRRLSMAFAAVLGCGLLGAPLALNTALAELHQGSASPQVAMAMEPVLEAARRLAWGPYESRAWAGLALAARVRGDPVGELTALAEASAAAPWDDTLYVRLGELRLAQGDRAGAVDAWRSAGLGDALLKRGETADTPEDALDWFALAQEVNPADWRAFAAAATILINSGRLDEAGPPLAEALWLKRDQPACEAVSSRLLDSTAPLPRLESGGISVQDGYLLRRAARVLAGRSDMEGARYAGHLAINADPSIDQVWR